MGGRAGECQSVIALHSNTGAYNYNLSVQCRLDRDGHAEHQADINGTVVGSGGSAVAAGVTWTDQAK